MKMSMTKAGLVTGLSIDESRRDDSAACSHGYGPGECPEDGCLYRREVKNALLGRGGPVANRDSAATHPCDGSASCTANLASCRVCNPSAACVYTTTDDEREAHEIAEALFDRGRKAVVYSVNEMHRRGDPLAPRTTNRWAVIAEAKS